MEHGWAETTLETSESGLFYDLCNVNPTTSPSVNSGVLPNVELTFSFCPKWFIAHLALKVSDKV